MSASDPDYSAAAPAEEVFEDARMTVFEHLGELRTRAIYSLVAVAICFGVSWIFVEEIFQFLLLPLKIAAPATELSQMHHKDIAEPFFALLKTAIVSGVFLGIPFIMYQLWAFVAPGLYPNERKAAIPFVIMATLFFYMGGSFCYYMVMPYGYKFLLNFAADVSKPQLMMNEYFAITTKLLLGFGIVFEMPVFSMFLSMVGVITHRTLLKYWRFAFVGAFIVAAMLTPPDVITQVMMAIPLVILYGISVIVAWFFTRSRERAAAAAEQ